MNDRYRNLLERLEDVALQDQLAEEAAIAIRELLSRRTMYEDVAAFHSKFNIPVAGVEPCKMPDRSIIDYRTKFLEEELQEFKDACSSNFLDDAFDALLDIAWVAMGTAHYFGIPWEQGWAEVVRANMDRVLVTRENCPVEKQYRKDMVMKPEGWRPPELLRVIREHNLSLKSKPVQFDVEQFLRLRDDIEEPPVLGAGLDIDLFAGLESEEGPEHHSFACTCEKCMPNDDGDIDPNISNVE